MPSAQPTRHPLQEAIFELHWALDEGDFGMLHDKGFDLAIGLFKDKVKASFPTHERLQPESVPQVQMLGIPAHQFWKEGYQSPVLQFGPGILAVNDIGEDYAWKGRLRDAIKTAIKHWSTSYGSPKKVESLRLQYLNGMDIGALSPVLFTTEMLQTHVVNGFSRPGTVEQFAIAQVYRLDDGSTLTLNITDGKNNTTGENSVFWRIIMEKIGEEIPVEDILDWANFAHDEISKFFRNLLHPTFYDRFR
jgi:uncharacterized protein (TIGR04255 family)